MEERLTEEERAVRLVPCHCVNSAELGRAEDAELLKHPLKRSRNASGQTGSHSVREGRVTGFICQLLREGSLETLSTKFDMTALPDSGQRSAHVSSLQDKATPGKQRHTHMLSNKTVYLIFQANTGHHCIEYH